MAYLTLVEYQRYISTLVAEYSATLGAAEETMLETLIAQAQDYIDKKTGRHFEAVTQTRVFLDTARVAYDPKLLLVDDDLLTVTALTNGNDDVITSDKYRLWPLNTNPKYGIRLKSDTSWRFTSESVVSVTGTWGYTATPSDLVKRLTARVTRHMEQTRSATGTVQVFGDGSRSFEAAIPSDVKDALAMLTRRRGDH